MTSTGHKRIEQDIEQLLITRREQLLELLKSQVETKDLDIDEPGDMVDKSEEIEAQFTKDRLGDHLVLELERIRSALAKMRTGTFGYCQSCDEEIPQKRLLARPDAQFCLPCQELSDRAGLRLRKGKAGTEHAAEL